ncbi:unnamed protein product [Peniophora sp. CBMAI 1063]|nr:unnamed protein product [Peniophora sp. CBMAI 1063]
MTAQGASASPSRKHLHSLPPELLVEIFRALAPPRYPQWPYSTSTGDPRRISQVCSSWRAITLGIRDLWTSIPIKNAYWAALSLDRSRPLPISISIVRLDKFGTLISNLRREQLKVAVHTLKTGVQTALSEPARICAFHAELSTYGNEAEFQAWFARKLFAFLEDADVPLLEHLVITVESLENIGQYSFFLGHQTPANLQYVSMYGLYRGDMPCMHLLSAPLTTLDLGSGTIWDFLPDALDSLSRLPTLESLSIRRDRDDMIWEGAILPPYDINVEPRSVSLPNLKKLYLYEPLDLIACLVRALAFPTSAAIKLYDANDEVDDPDLLVTSVRDCIDVIVAGLNAHYAPLVAEGRPYRGLCLLSRARDHSEFLNRVHVVADYAIRGQELQDSRAYLMPDRIDRELRVLDHKPQDRTLDISITGDETLEAHILVEILTGLPVLREARALTFYDKSYDPCEAFHATGPQAWLDALRYLGGIQVAHLHGYIAVRHLKALVANDVHYHDFTPRVLVIEDVSFLPDPKPPSISLEELVLALKKCSGFGRQAVEEGVMHVEIIYCDIDDEQVLRLRREFGDNSVSWDGLTRGSKRSRRKPCSIYAISDPG